ncbi:MAG: hypothetical protein LLF92_10030 [Planctomycetaceae bacterium]|nr:hypothetical protein [Planctomycetaceae bacterium]
MKNSYSATIAAILAVVFYANIITASQINIPRIELMPNMPVPYQMRNWKQVARDYDNYIFSFTRTTSSSDSWWKTYPIIWWDTNRVNYSWNTFGMPSYVGRYDQTSGGAHESINVLGAVLGGTLAGIDKSNQYVAATGQYYNFVLMQQQYYNLANGENMVLNYTSTDSGQSFWYEVFPPLLFCQLLAKYPNTGSMETLMYAMADRLYNAEYAMGGRTSPWTVPNFTHTAFDFDTMTPFDNGNWNEPDAAAGYAWIEYMAYVKWSAPQHLMGAKWGIEYLYARSDNPLYEVLLPYGAYTAARMNAETGTSYNLYKILNWCFQPSTASDARYGWGVIADSPWGGYDCDGLVGSVTDGDGYAFAMNTFQWAAALAPIPRYNQDYARAIGKWILNAANASRLFYTNGLDAAHQSGENWSYIYDPCNCIAYEGLRKTPRIVDRVASDYSNTYGTVTATYVNTHLKDNKYEIFKEQTVGAFDKLDHLWLLNIEHSGSHTLHFHGRYFDGGDVDSGFILSYAILPNGIYTDMFTVDNTGSNQEYTYDLPLGLSGAIYIKVRDTNPDTAGTGNDGLYVNWLMVITETTGFSPYAMGDGLMWGMGTDFALYGASHVGMLAAIVEPTNVEKILRLDLLATDYYHAPAYPTYLYYNPYTTAKNVQIDVDQCPVDLYDTVSQTFLKTDVSGITDFDITPDSAVVIVLAPAGGQITISSNKKFVNNVVIDYKTNTNFATCAQIQASPQRLVGDIVGDCIVDMQDVAELVEHWLEQSICSGRADINDDNIVNFIDLNKLADNWLANNKP